MRICGRAWVFGDLVDTDVLAPGPHMRKPIDALARHCLEALDPRFAAEVRPGDIVVAGEGFGIGSSREQAAQALLQLGVGAVLARSFARIFYRNALNLGLPAMVCAGITVEPGERLEVLPGEGVVRSMDRDLSFQGEPVPPRLLEVLAAGGLMPWLAGRFHP